METTPLTRGHIAKNTLNILHAGNSHSLSYRLSALLLYTKKQDAWPQKTHIKRIASVTQSIESLKISQPDVIVLEFEHGNEKELRALKRLRLCAGAVPIIVVSAAAEHSKFGHDAIYYGANDYLAIRALNWDIFCSALHSATNNETLRKKDGSPYQAQQEGKLRLTSIGDFRKLLNARIEAYTETGSGNAALIQCNLANYSKLIEKRGSAVVKQALDVSLQRLVNSIDGTLEHPTSSGGTVYLLMNLEDNSSSIEASIKAAAQSLASPVFIEDNMVVMDACFGIAYLADDTFSSAEDWMIAAQVATQIARSSRLPYYFSRAFPMEDLDAILD